MLKLEVLKMMEILIEIIDWKMDPNVEWNLEDECTTIGEMVKRADALLQKAKKGS